MANGAILMTSSTQLELALPGEILLAIGMGVCNAAVFKLVPQDVPEAVGGAAGWVGGLGALGGFVIPPILGFAVHDLGQRGYAIGFIVFVFLALFGLGVVWVLKYTRDAPVAGTATIAHNGHDSARKDDLSAVPEPSRKL